MTRLPARGFRFWLGAVACGAALSGACAVAQSSPEPPPPGPGQTATLKVTTRLVVLDVVVVDKAGHAVSNLDRSQFSVTENKVDQRIRSFDAPSGHTMPGGSSGHPVVRSTADLAKIGNAPVNILVFDELNTKWEATAYARMRMEKYLQSQPEVLPVPTLLVASGDSRFIVLHDYTQSRAELLESVHKHFPQYPWQMMRGSSGNTNIELMEQTLGALSQIAESSRGTPGRKNVIWVGSGYPSVDMTSLKFDDEDKLAAIIRLVTDRMMASRITLYMVDPQGVQTTSEQRGAGNDDESFTETGITSVLGPYTDKLDFASFATATGGEIFANRNDLEVAIGDSVKEGGVYYTLSYAPSERSDAAKAYRHIQVKLKDPSLHAIARDGYFAETAAVAPLPVGKEKPAMLLKFDLMSAARSRLAYNGLKVAAKRTGAGYSLLVGAKDLHWEDVDGEARVADLTVLTVFFNAKDKELKSSATELKEKISAGAALTAGSQVELKLNMDAPPAAARVRFVVRDAVTGTVGTADQEP